MSGPPQIFENPDPNLAPPHVFCQVSFFENEILAGFSPVRVSNYLGWRVLRKALGLIRSVRVSKNGRPAHLVVGI